MKLPENSLYDYRQSLQKGASRAQGNYDKYLISLAGGGLGVSIAFVRDFVGSSAICLQQYLAASWLLWLITIALVLYSFFTSANGFRKAVKQVDAGSIYTQHPGGKWDKLTRFFNAAAGVMFILGTLSSIIFVLNNLRR